jgi:flagellar motility protein MotE (MotC chaperone)
MNVVKERESQMANRQTQLQLIYDDIRDERAAIDELRKQIEDELKTVDAQLAAAEQRHAEVEQQQQELKGRVTEMAGDEKDNIKKMAGMYDTMPPEGAAKIIQEMCDGGSMDTAVKLLSVMKERQAAKLFAEMSDTALVAQLTEKLKTLKRPTPPARK